MRTEVVTESSPALVDLTADEALALRRLGHRLASTSSWWGKSPYDDERERAVILCEPTTSGKHRLLVRDAIGVVCVHDLQIEVRPKIALEHLLFLAEQSRLVPRIDGQRSLLQAGANLWELVGRWFVTQLAEVLRADLIKDYRTQIDALPLASGRLLAMPTTRSYYAGRLTMTCEYEMFDEDTPVNRVLKAAATAVVAAPAGSDGLRRDARRLLASMHGVGEVRANDLTVPTDQRARHYRDAHLLGRQLLVSRLRSPQVGSELGWTFLMRTPDVAEVGVREALARLMAPAHKLGKSGMQIQGTKLRLQPDLVVPGHEVGDCSLLMGGWPSSAVWRRSVL